MILALTTNAISIFIMYLYMYLLKSLYLLEFIVVSIFIQLECIYSICISTVFIRNVFIQFYFCFVYIYLFIFIGLDLIFFSQYMCYKIYWGNILFRRKGMLYWENNAYMYWVKEQLCIKLLVAEAACAASAYLSSVLL